MNAIIETVNSAGRAFIEFALPMFIQSSVLILILLALDVVLRRQVRAVFRYWIWMLVLLKLVLPPSLGSPVSIGTWLGDKLESPTLTLNETPASQHEPTPAQWRPPVVLNRIEEVQTFTTSVAAASDSLPMDVSQPDPAIASERASDGATSAQEAPHPPAPALSWQALVLLAWAAVALALLLLLLQRALFVRGLVVQAQEAPPELIAALDQCRTRMGMSRPIAVRVSHNATSPAVCGLLRPVILIPQSLAPRLQPHDLRAVLLHELAHIKRGDLWVNLIQTLLQIAYFYNPFLWLANVVMRRVREQAVDEAVLVAMGETARDYPETLLNVAKLAFHRHPALSLRLIGVVESKSALRSRIKHILNRPLPKTARLGLLGLVVVFLIAAILLPMAKARPMTDRAGNVMSLADEEARRLNHTYVGTEHILLALARQEDAISTKVLANLDADLDTLRAEVNRFVRPGPEPVTERRLLLTPRAQRVMQYAREEAKALGHEYIGTEHILLALLRDKDGVAAQVLAALGITETQIRAHVLTFVQSAVQDSGDSGDEDAGGGVLVGPRAGEPSGVVAELPNGVTVEFVAYSHLNTDDLRWYTPEGQPTTISNVYEADVEGLGPVLAFRMEPEVESFYIWSVQPPNRKTNLEKRWCLQDSGIWLVALGEQDRFVNVEIQAILADPAVLVSIACDARQARDQVEINEYGILRIGNLEAMGNGGSRLNVHTVMGDPQVVAVLDEAGRPHSVRKVPRPYGQSDGAGGLGLRLEADLPASLFAGILVDARATGGGRVTFRNISLDPGRSTETQVEIVPEQQGPWWGRSERFEQFASLAEGLAGYARFHSARYPYSLADIERGGEEWIDQHVVYLGRGKTSTDDPPAVVAYQKTLLSGGYGTYVAYSDGHVQFNTPAELQELRIVTDDSEMVASVESGQSNITSAARFTVRGVVTGASGQPMEGVWVNVDCGFERPQRAGRTLTDEGGRYTLGFESAWVVTDADPYGVGIQPAFVYAQKEGFYETSLCHKGNLAMAGKAPGPDEQRFVASRAGVVLMNQPYELNLVMAPAALVTGQLVDAEGRPVANRDIYLHSDQMYPPGRSYIHVQARSDGTFGPCTVPCTSFRFSCPEPLLAPSDEITFTRPGNWRVTLKYRQTGSQTAQLLVEDLYGPTNGSPSSLSTAPQPTATGLSGRVVDPSGAPVAGAQVAWIDAERSVEITDGRLMPPRFGDRGKGPIIETDERGHFRFEEEPNDGFSLLTAHEAGFALIGSEEFDQDHVIRLRRWGRVEGRVAQGREPAGDKIWMSGLPNSTSFEHRRDYRYETLCDAEGQFTFKRVPPGWFEVGYLVSNGDFSSSLTSRTPVVVEPGRTATVTLGGEGRPVIGRFVPPDDYEGPVYFGAGLRALDTVRPDMPTPDDYDQMTKRQQQEWIKRWHQTPDADEYRKAVWHDLNRRHYTFRIQEDGTFRIEDVIPGKHNLTVWLEERLSGERPEEIGGYSGTVEVPPMDQAYSDEPLGVGDLVLRMNRPLHVGDAAPLFEARTLDGKEIRLVDYRGRFVLLNFWSPVFSPELARLKELHATYAGTGKLQIIGLGGTDTLDEVRKCVEEHDVEWPEIYFGPDWDADLLKQLGGQMQILLIDPEGKIVATWLRDEKLTNTVQKALGEPN